MGRWTCMSCVSLGSLGYTRLPEFESACSFTVWLCSGSLTYVGLFLEEHSS